MPFVPITQLLAGRLGLTLACCLSVALPPAMAYGQDANLVAAAQMALQTQNEGALAKLVAPLRKAVQDRAGASSALLLAWGRTEARAGEVDSALSAYVDLTARRDMRGRGMLEQARLLLERGMRNGPELWYLGAEVAERAVWADYRRDLLPLLSVEERRSLDGLPAGAARVRWLQTFWEGRAGRDMRTADARLAEHYIRLRFARTNYRSVYALEQTPATVDEELDDRGRIYLRHGAADRVIKAGAPVVNDDAVARPTTVLAADGGSAQRGTGFSERVPASEVWSYAVGDSSRVHIFAIVDCHRRQGGGVVNAVYGCARSRDYVALESIYDAFGPGFSRAVASRSLAQGAPGIRLSPRENIGGDDAGLLSTTGLLDDFQQFVQTASAVDSRWGTLLGALRWTQPAQAQKEREAMRLDLQHGLGSDSYAYRYVRTMRARIEPLRAGREGPNGVVHLAYAVRAEDLSPTRTQGQIEYPMRVILRAEDSVGTVLASFNKKTIFRMDGRLGDQASVMGREAITVPPGTHQLRVVLEHNDSIGTVLAPVTIAVPTAVRGQLSGGDLVLGHAEFPLEWVRAPGDTVRFNPSAVFSKVDGLELYHELYGLASGESYRYTVTLLRPKGGVFGGNANALTLSGEDRATGDVTSVRRYLDVKTLKPGRYEVQVLYESDTAGRYEVRRSFTLNE